MKTFEEISQDIKATRARIDESKANEKRLETEWMKEENPLSRREVKRNLEKEWSDAEAKTQDLAIMLRILKNNARIALFHEVMPVLLDVLKKYNRKPYGEKTRDKISKEFEERTGCRAYIFSSYTSDEIRIFPKRGSIIDEIDVGTYYNKEKRDCDRVLIDNKIQVLPLEKFRLHYIRNEYIEDIPKAISEMKALHAKAVEMQKALRAACAEFNRYAVSGIGEIQAERYINERIYLK